MSKYFNTDNDVESKSAEEQDWDLINQKNLAVSKCYDWFETDRQAKQPITAEFDEMYKLFKGDHWNLLDASGSVLRTDTQKQNHPNAVENITFSLIEGLVAEFAVPKDLVDFPTEEGDEEAALVMTDLKEFIAYKNRFDTELIKWLRNFYLYGTGIWKSTWDPTWKGGKGPNRWEGDIRWKSTHPRSIFPDARCMESVEDGRRVHDARYWTIEDVEETWPDAQGITPDSISSDIVVNEDLEYTTAETAEDQVLVVETWYKGSPLILEDDEEDEGPGLHLIMWAGEGSLKYLTHQNYCYFDPDEETTFPINMKKCYERERSPWGVGEALQLKSPQMITNKTAEMIVEGHMFESLGQTWYDASALTEKQKKKIEEKGTLYGMWFEVTDIQGVKREYGKGVPASVQNEMTRLQRVMESIVGRYDISQGRTPGSITAFRALDLMNSRAQVRLRSKEQTLNSSLEECGNYINRLIARHYTDQRRYRIRGKEDDKLKFGTYDAGKMKRAYFYDTSETMPYSDLEPLLAGQEELPPEDQMIEGEHYEVYYPEFDTKCKVSSQMPSDRAFYMEMAKELYSAQIIDIETFYYTMEHGKFPPWEKIQERMMQQQQMQQQAALEQQQMALPPGQEQEQLMTPEEEQQVQEFIEYLKVNAPEILQEIGQQPEDKRMMILLNMMQDLQAKGRATPTNGEEIPLEEGVPPQADAEAIRQQLLDLLELQKGGEIQE